MPPCGTASSGSTRARPRNSGPIQLEIFNLGGWPVVLDAGMPICQLIFEEVREVPSEGYAGQFRKQNTFTV
jgi:deoxycytidine triphosphate deaminase